MYLLYSFIVFILGVIIIITQSKPILLILGQSTYSAAEV